jgi:VCBS repeat-containing protein
MTAPFGENGGFAATQYVLFVPAQLNSGGPAFIGTFSADNYNDTFDGSSYSYRVEDVVVGAYPTVRRLFVVYKDVGQATITFTVTGTNDNAQVVSNSQTQVIGNTNPTNALMGIFFDIQLAAYMPQVSWSRAAGAGPVCIVSVTLIGEVEEASQ